MGDSFLIWYWLNQHGIEAMLDMPLWSCQLQQHMLADTVTVFKAVTFTLLVREGPLVNLEKIPINY